MSVPRRNHVTSALAAVAASATLILAAAPAHADAPSPLELTVDRFGFVGPTSEPGVAVTGTATCPSSSTSLIVVTFTQGKAVAGPVDDDLECNAPTAVPWTSFMVPGARFHPGQATVDVVGYTCVEDPGGSFDCTIATEVTRKVILGFDPSHHLHA
jgi:hypothetical protein